MRIFLDANVLFSAAKSAGAVRALLHRLRETEHVLCVDAYVIFEAQRNLELKAESAGRSLDVLLERCEVSPSLLIARSAEWAPLLPEKDRPVLSAAIAMRCDALITGDRTHFGPLYGRTIERVTIHSPRSLAEQSSLRL